MSESRRSRLSDRHSELLSRLHDGELSGQEEKEANELLADNELALAFFAEIGLLRAVTNLPRPKGDDQEDASPELVQPKPRPKQRRIGGPEGKVHLKRSTSETLARLHGRSDRSNKKTVVVLMSVLLGFFVLLIVAIRIGREDEASPATVGSQNSASNVDETLDNSIPQRIQLAVLHEPEGRVVNTIDTSRALEHDTGIWDGEAIETEAGSGGTLRFQAGGRIEFGPHSRLTLGDGTKTLARVDSGFVALDFKKKDSHGIIELGNFGQVEVSPGLRLVVYSTAETAAPVRSIFLHAQRGEARLKILGEDLVLPTSSSAALELERVGGSLEIRRRAAYSRVTKKGPISAQTTGQVKFDKASESGFVLMVVADGEKKVISDADRLTGLDFLSRVLASDLVDQARSLNDGAAVDVDMFTYLNEKSSLDSGLQIIGANTGDVESDVVITLNGEVVAQGPLVKMADKIEKAQQGRFDRMLGQVLCPNLASPEKQHLLMLKADPAALSQLARAYVTVPENLQGEKLYVQANLMKYLPLLMRAIATQLGCDIVNTDDYGIAFVPRQEGY